MNDLPPAIYDHPYAGPVIEMVMTAPQVNTLCIRMGKVEASGRFIGCSWKDFRPLLCRHFRTARPRRDQATRDRALQRLASRSSRSAMMGLPRLSFTSAPPAWFPPAMAHAAVGDLTIGQILAVLEIAGTPEATQAAAIIVQEAAGLIQPMRQDLLSVVIRGLARRGAGGFALTLRGQLIGSAVIAAATRQTP